MKRCVLSLERKVGKEFEFRVSGGSEFQSRGPMTEKALLPCDDPTYGMERTSEFIQFNSNQQSLSQALPYRNSITGAPVQFTCTK